MFVVKFPKVDVKFIFKLALIFIFPKSDNKLILLLKP